MIISYLNAMHLITLTTPTLISLPPLEVPFPRYWLIQFSDSVSLTMANHVTTDLELFLEYAGLMSE